MYIYFKDESAVELDWARIGFGSHAEHSAKDAAKLFVKCLKKKDFSEYTKNFAYPEIENKNFKSIYNKLNIKNIEAAQWSFLVIVKNG